MSTRATSTAAKAARREQILQAAAELFDRLGYEQASASLIAERATLAKGSLYTYFPSREAIFISLYERALDDWLVEMERRVIDSAQQLDDPLLQLVGELVDSLARAPRLGPLASLLRPVLERGLDRPALLAARQRQEARLRQAALVLSDRRRVADSEAAQQALSRFLGLLVSARHVVAGSSESLPDEQAVLEELENTAYRLFSVSQG
ncbi:MAG: TetR/AcrR family transcriptional regulator [Gammaproteobacteria bacterium]|nr:TetR/AcrR family transcriptional regulator [Gammaproteobacteria bacterium]